MIVIYIILWLIAIISLMVVPDGLFFVLLIPVVLALVGLGVAVGILGSEEML